MKTRHLLALFFIFWFTTGASLIDQDTRSNVEDLQSKVGELLTIHKGQEASQNELITTLKARGEADAKLIKRLQTIEASQEQLLKQLHSQTKSQNQLLKTLRSKGNDPVIASQDLTPILSEIETLRDLFPLQEEVLGQLSELPKLIAANIVIPAAPTPIIAESDWTNEFASLETFNKVSIGLSVFGLLGILILTLLNRRNLQETKIQLRELERSVLKIQLPQILKKKVKKKKEEKEVAPPVEVKQKTKKQEPEVTERVFERPQLEITPNARQILLTNIGKTPAHEIRLSMGAAPSTLRERHRVMGELHNGEETILDLQHWEGDKLFGSVVYRSPLTGKTYKDNFIFRYSNEEGRFYREAS